MSYEEDNECTGCSSREVEALLRELLDTRQSAQRQREIRARLAACSHCLDRLRVEEIVRSMMRECCHSVEAPERLRRKITVQIRSTETSTSTSYTEYRWS